MYFSPLLKLNKFRRSAKLNVELSITMLLKTYMFLALLHHPVTDIHSLCFKYKLVLKLDRGAQRDVPRTSAVLCGLETMRLWPLYLCLKTTCCNKENPMVSASKTWMFVDLFFVHSYFFRRKKHMKASRSVWWKLFI